MSYEINSPDSPKTLSWTRVGLVSNFADVWRFVKFVEGLRDQTRLAIGEVSFDIDSCRVIRDGS